MSLVSSVRNNSIKTWKAAASGVKYCKASASRPRPHPHPPPSGTASSIKLP